MLAIGLQCGKNCRLWRGARGSHCAFDPRRGRQTASRPKEPTVRRQSDQPAHVLDNRPHDARDYASGSGLGTCDAVAGAGGRGVDGDRGRLFDRRPRRDRARTHPARSVPRPVVGFLPDFVHRRRTSSPSPSSTAGSTWSIIRSPSSRRSSTRGASSGFTARSSSTWRSFRRFTHRWTAGCSCG